MDNKNNPKREITGSEALAGLIFVGGIVCFKFEQQIRWWFFDHLMMLLLTGFSLLALVVMYGLNKIKKKEAETLARMRALKSVKPEKREQNYYERRKR